MTKTGLYYELFGLPKLQKTLHSVPLKTPDLPCNFFSEKSQFAGCLQVQCSLHLTYIKTSNMDIAVYTDKHQDVRLLAGMHHQIQNNLI